MSQAFDRIPWGRNPPDTSNERYYPLVRPTCMGPLYGQLISQTIISAPTHWLDNGTRPCLGSKEHCEGCRCNCVVRWKAYAAILARQSGKIGLLELTGEAIKNCPRLQGDGRVVRGVHVKVYRRGKYSNAPVVVEIVGEAHPDEVKVADFDVRPHLGRIWGVLPTKGMHKGNAKRQARRQEGGES